MQEPRRCALSGDAPGNVLGSRFQGHCFSTLLLVHVAKHRGLGFEESLLLSEPSAPQGRDPRV